MKKTEVNWELMHKNIADAYEEVSKEVVAAHQRGEDVPYCIGNLRFELELALLSLKRLKNGFI
jgi:hypothetical protein